MVKIGWRNNWRGLERSKAGAAMLSYQLRADRGRGINDFTRKKHKSVSNGRRGKWAHKCTLTNWTGIAYKIPRITLNKCKDRADLKQSGVYFLFGASENIGEGVVYIGQAGVRKNGEGILCRLQEHEKDSDKDYWTEAVVFTTSNNSFGPTEISYLENRFYALAADAKRYIVKNEIEPVHGNITEEKESELEEFIDYAKIVTGSLGHKVFEPLLAANAQSDIETGEPMMFYRNSTGQRTSDGFVILKGSVIASKLQKSCPSNVREYRKLHRLKIDESFALTENILLPSPSAAAFVAGASESGNRAWKTAGGETLPRLEILKHKG